MDTKNIRVRMTLAQDEVSGLCKGERKWRMCIPVQSTDSDVVISTALNDIAPLLDYAATLERLIYECATLSSVMLSGVEDGEKIYHAIHAKLDKQRGGQG